MNSVFNHIKGNVYGMNPAIDKEFGTKAKSLRKIEC